MIKSKEPSMTLIPISAPSSAARAREPYQAPAILAHTLGTATILQSTGEKTIQFDTTVNPDYTDPDDERILNL